MEDEVMLINILSGILQKYFLVEELKGHAGSGSTVNLSAVKWKNNALRKELREWQEVMFEA